MAAYTIKPQPHPAPIRGLGRQAQALDYYCDVAKTFPNSVTVLLNQSQAMAALGRYGEAAALVSDALEYNETQNAVPTAVLEEALASFNAVLAAEAAEKQRQAAEAEETKPAPEQPATAPEEGDAEPAEEPPAAEPPAKDSSDTAYL